MCYLFSGGDFCEKYQASNCNVIFRFGGIKYSAQIQDRTDIITGLAKKECEVNSLLAARDHFTTLEKIGHFHVPHFPFWYPPLPTEGLGFSNWCGLSLPGCPSILSTVQGLEGDSPPPSQPWLLTGIWSLNLLWPICKQRVFGPCLDNFYLGCSCHNPTSKDLTKSSWELLNILSASTPDTRFLEWFKGKAKFKRIKCIHLED